jgi:hypothetical protein
MFKHMVKTQNMNEKLYKVVKIYTVNFSIKYIFINTTHLIKTYESVFTLEMQTPRLVYPLPIPSTLL